MVYTAVLFDDIFFELIHVGFSLFSVSFFGPIAVCSIRLSAFDVFDVLFSMVSRISCGRYAELHLISFQYLPL